LLDVAGEVAAADGDAEGSPEGEAAGAACGLPPAGGVDGAAALGGAEAEIVPAEPLHAPPAASWTVTVG